MLSLIACSTQKQGNSNTYIQREYINQKQTGRDGTLTWYEDERAGAAYNKEAYKHVLASRNSELLTDHSPEPDISDNPENVIEKIKVKSYSIYETRRWERFCGTGKMDSKDWDFIAKEGREHIPEQLKDNCSPPSYTRQDYIKAWENTCSNTKRRAGESVILNNTIRPPNICKTKS